MRRVECPEVDHSIHGNKSRQEINDLGFFVVTRPEFGEWEKQEVGWVALEIGHFSGVRVHNGMVHGEVEVIAFFEG